MMYYILIVLLTMINYISAMEHSAIVRHRSLSQEKLSALTSSSLEHEKPECPLCFEPYDELDKKRIPLICDKKRTDIQHTFCTQCLKAWFAKNQTCPTCRQVIPKEIMEKNEPQRRNLSNCFGYTSLFLSYIYNSREQN